MRSGAKPAEEMRSGAKPAEGAAVTRKQKLSDLLSGHRKERETEKSRKQKRAGL